MKYYFDGIIVVEGKQDVSFLSSFIETEYVITNGYEIPYEEIQYLNAVSDRKKVIVLTDSDEAGISIRQKVQIQNSINVFVNIDLCNKHNKHGVAECDKEEIIKELHQYLSETPFIRRKMSIAFLNSIGLNKKENRYLFSKKVPVGSCNTKKLAYRLMTLGINENDVSNTMKEINHAD